MQDWVQQKLAAIDELFPPRRIAQSQERIARLWHRQPPLDRYPFTYTPATLDYYAADFTPERRLRQLLDEIILHGRVSDDFIPALFPGCSQATIPNMFGAEEINLNGDFTCQHILTSDEDVARLSEPVLGPVAQRWLELERYFLEQTQGRLPIHPCDMQGPADVSGQLWGYDQLFLSAYTAPDQYARMMSRTTAAFELLWETQRQAIGAGFIGTHLWGWNYVPPDAGASLSADSLAMLSVDFYQEHYQSWLVRLGKRFGGLSVHSCGKFGHLMKPLLATPWLKAIHAGEMTVTQLVDAGADDSVLIIAGMPAADYMAAFALIRTRQLRVDLNLGGFFQLDTPKPIAEWSLPEFDLLRRREEPILEQARRVDLALPANAAPLECPLM